MNTPDFNQMINMAVHTLRKEGEEGDPLQLHLAYRPDEPEGLERWAAAIGFVTEAEPSYTATGRSMEVALAQLLVEMGVMTVQASQ